MVIRILPVLFVLASPVAGADDPKPPADEEVKAAQARVAEFLKAIKGAEAARVAALTGDGIAATFPDHYLVAVMFPQYPVARVAPEPLRSSNVVAVPRRKDGKPTPVTDLKELEKFFRENARPVRSGADAEATATAWLRAAAELNQDGFYKFTVKAERSDDATKAAGTAAVDPQGGNKGEIKATLTFKDGKPATVETTVKLLPGPRPICQATKLLDPDPIVRRMAEDAILVMGSAAKPYLDEQRAKATAELRGAIDRIRARIVAEDR